MNFVEQNTGKRKKNSFLTIVLLVIALLSGGGYSIREYLPGQTTESTTEALGSGSQESYTFRRAEYLQEHFEKHGSEFGYATKEEYLAGANKVIHTPGVLHKLEAEDGDDVYFLEKTGEFVIVSTDGYLRTYFKPNDGISYYNRQ